MKRTRKKKFSTTEKFSFEPMRYKHFMWGDKMYRAISSEFLKLRRSRLMLLLMISGILPSLIKFLQLSFSKDTGNQNWEVYLTTGKEILVLGILITVILVSGFLFNMEYHYKTVSYMLTSGVSRIQIYISKLISLFGVIASLLVVSGLSELIFGILLVKTVIPGTLFVSFLKVTLWYVMTYFLLSCVVIMVSVVTKRFVITSVITLGYLIMTFPFQLKNSVYLCPFMTPAAAAAKLYGTNYIFNNAYKDMAINSLSVLGYLVVLAVISTTVGLALYKNSDAVS